MYMDLKKKYGPLAIIAGASEGMGAAFARALAAQGMNLIIVARRKKNLEALAEELIQKHHIEVETFSCDLSLPDATEQIKLLTTGRLINFMVYNAALSYIGPFQDNPVTEHLRIAAVNMLTPIGLIHHFGNQMLKQGRGGIVLMSSLAGFQGSGFLATYAATKAFNRILAESLWYEWKSRGVDVIGCCAGATLTPNYIHSNPKKISVLAPKPQLPEQVAAECLSKIGKTPSFISGRANKIACFLMNHIFSVKKAINIMGDTTRKMYGIVE
jgi:short-subunit dehydrogenase